MSDYEKYSVTPRDARDYDGALYIMNTTSSTIIYPIGDDSRGISRSSRLEPIGGRVSAKAIDKSALSSPGVQKLWRMGRVRIITEEGYDQYFFNADAERQEANEQARLKSLANIDDQSVEISVAKNDRNEKVYTQEGVPIHSDFEATNPGLQVLQGVDEKGEYIYSEPKVTIGSVEK